MTRRPAIRDAEASVIVSHGADFFGQDRHSLKQIADLAEYVEASVSYADRLTVAPLIKFLKAPAFGTFPAADAAQLSEHLLRVARNRGIRPAVAALARSLGDAAARAASDGDPWSWTVEGPTAP
ncbi:hypothetical protein [Streptomyces acidiscabies]|uniref:DUF7739 domain-containing protein n=1 Tax=Streptomyces acidiscabies TaxID=42234 RepID=UPI000E6A4ACF|nr:hypothetical protein [Streptomyces acidiscabies]MBP5942587.1 hypothetical protein [Streptomyces sp. LBUM 1476]